MRTYSRHNFITAKHINLIQEQNGLFTCQLTPLVPQMDGNVILGMKVWSSVKYGISNFLGPRKELATLEVSNKEFSLKKGAVWAVAIAYRPEPTNF